MVHRWDVVYAVDLTKIVPMKGGMAAVGVAGTGIRADTYGSSTSSGRKEAVAAAMNINLHSLNFRGRLPSVSVSTLPLVSEHMRAASTDIAATISDRVSILGLWIGLKININMPMALNVVFDVEAMSAYQRLFSVLFKVCPVPFMMTILSHIMNLCII